MATKREEGRDEETEERHYETQETEKERRKSQRIETDSASEAQASSHGGDTPDT